MECSKRYSFEEHRSKLLKNLGGASAPPSTYLSTALLCVYVCMYAYVCVCMCVVCACVCGVCVWVGGCHNSTAYTCTTEQQ